MEHQISANPILAAAGADLDSLPGLPRDGPAGNGLGVLASTGRCCNTTILTRAHRPAIGKTHSTASGLTNRHTPSGEHVAVGIQRACAAINLYQKWSAT
jgi:hypothetical protein